MIYLTNLYKNRPRPGVPFLIRFLALVQRVSVGEHGPEVVFCPIVYIEENYDRLTTMTDVRPTFTRSMEDSDWPVLR